MLLIISLFSGCLSESKVDTKTFRDVSIIEIEDHKIKFSNGMSIHSVFDDNLDYLELNREFEYITFSGNSIRHIQDYKYVEGR